MNFLKFLLISVFIVSFVITYDLAENVCKDISTDNPEECTIALIAECATPDGRPLLWKNRDIPNWRQEFHFYEETPYSFIGITFAGNEEEAWGGVNEVGFAIVNANAYNFPDSTGVPDDDGIIMYHALQTCERVADFIAYMDTTAQQGRTHPAIYGVLDANGGGGMLEASLYENYWFDANDNAVAPNGIMVRATFAYCGDSIHVGQFRHDRALELLDYAVQSGEISARYIIDVVARDLKTEDVDPYPLPYQGSLGDSLYGCVQDQNAINRETSRSCLVVHGVQPGENPLTSTLWAQVGQSVMTPMIPLWVAALSVPPEVDGDPYSPMCNRAHQFYEYLYLPYSNPYDDIIDTWKLIDDRGKGLLTYLRDLEGCYYDFVEITVEGWRTNFPSANEIAVLQDSLSALAYQAMMNYNPPLPIDSLVIQIEGEDLRLTWFPVNFSVFGDTISVSGYSIYTNETLFYNRMSGDSLGFTLDTTFVLPVGVYPLSAFYQVRGVMLEE
ncbi:MAG: hypothetical protein H8E87_04615 [FCB group bacterium]|nr:hypothetical protein [FCB group bacterium]